MRYANDNMDERNGPDWKLLRWPIAAFVVGFCLTGALIFYASVHSDERPSDQACSVVVIMR